MVEGRVLTFLCEGTAPIGAGSYRAAPLLNSTSGDVLGETFDVTVSDP